MHVGPFFSRAYAGYSAAQASFLSAVVPLRPGIRILDPMSGQAFLVGSWAHAGARVDVRDVNAGPLALATLRAPDVVRHRSVLADHLLDTLHRIPFERLDTRLVEAEDWLTPQTRSALRALGSAIRLDGSMERLEAAFISKDRFPRFAIGICALAARRLAAFAVSDNLTWLVPGGHQKSPHVEAALTAALHEWSAWANQLATRRGGSLKTALVDVRHQVGRADYDLVVCSPPYANRLDYYRMWGPENEVISALSATTLSQTARAQLATNEKHVVDATALRALPRSTRATLETIRTEPAWGSENYYFPYFANYAIRLWEACQRLAAAVARGGKAVVFVRDTVRMDTLFETGDLVEKAFQVAGFSIARHEETVIRSHYGNVRKARKISLLGRAQREHWLVFERQ